MILVGLKLPSWRESRFLGTLISFGAYKVLFTFFGYIEVRSLMLVELLADSLIFVVTFTPMTLSLVKLLTLRTMSTVGFFLSSDTVAIFALCLDILVSSLSVV